MTANTQKSVLEFLLHFFFYLYIFSYSKVCDEYSCIFCWKTLQRHEGTAKNTLYSVIGFVRQWCLY